MSIDEKQIINDLRAIADKIEKGTFQVRGCSQNIEYDAVYHAVNHELHLSCIEDNND